MSAKQVLIGGGTGFIGQRLTKSLSAKGYDITIISRMPGLRHITWHDLDSKGIPKGTVAVVNLAGQNVLDPTRRWTTGFKQNVWNSRINSASSIVRAIEASSDKPEVFINISGVALYKPDDKDHDETESGSCYDFMSALCIDWEKAATLSPDIPTRNVKIRSGVVIGREGGMIKSLYLPFFFGLGGPIGSGKQPLPWIHITDLCNMITFAIENKKVEGVLNGVGPKIITNAEFTKAFASALRRPAFFPLPEFVVNLIFDKERGIMLTKGQKVVPKRVLDYGFKYEYPNITDACKEVCSNSNN